MEQQRPRVTLKLAQTLDGRIATSTGHSRWVSGPVSRVFAHRLRTEHDAILAGIGTILSDNPQLNARDWPGTDPVRVVLDSHLRIPSDARVIKSGTSQTIVATTDHANSKKSQTLGMQGVTVLHLPNVETGIDLGLLMTELLGLRIKSILVEGGAAVATSFLRERLVDRIILIVAPKIIGSGTDSVNDLGIRNMDEAIQLADISVERLGDDLVVQGRPIWHR